MFAYLAACEEEFEVTSTPMTFTTPGFMEGVYPSGQNCLYKFEAAEGMKVKLQFTSFELESCLDCGCDFLQVRNKTILSARDLHDVTLVSVLTDFGGGRGGGGGGVARLWQDAGVRR